MLTLTIKVATVQPQALSFCFEPPVTSEEATEVCAAWREDQRVIPNDALAPGDVKICFEDETGSLMPHSDVAFSSSTAPQALESLLGVPADLVSSFIAAGKVVAEMMLEGRSDEEIDYVIKRLDREMGIPTNDIE